MIKEILKQKKKILFIFFGILSIEALSFISYFYPILNNIIFFSLLFLFLIIAIYKFKYSIYLIFAELFFNSMGYVFYFENSGFKISIRISFWLILMSVFLAKIIIKLLRNKKEIIQEYFKIEILRYFFVFFLFLGFSLIFGIMKNGFSDAFFDFNAWLYLSLIFPVYYLIYKYKKEELQEFRFDLIIIFISAILFLVFKSLLFLFLFSHNLQYIISDIYYWTRTNYLGEITSMSGGFYRIFLQVQIFILIAFIASLVFWFKTFLIKYKVYLFIFLSFLSSALILSFSRSFWLAGICVVFLLFLFLILKLGFKKILETLIIFILSFSFGFLIVFSVIKFPWPSSSVEFGFDSISERANIKSSESAISSRWALLEVMKKDLYQNILIGRGFGARLEYKSSDPRVIERSADGIYSTYAFEWAWLDICLKMGVLALIFYIYLIFKIIKNLYREFIISDNYLYLAIILSLLALSIVNFFTPYLNHPLGIGFLIISTIFLENKKDYA